MSRFLIVISLVFTIPKALAQPGPPPPDPAQPVPISGVEILLMMGGLLGIKGIKKSKSKT